MRLLMTHQDTIALVTFTLPFRAQATRDAISGEAIGPSMQYTECVSDWSSTTWSWERCKHHDFHSEASQVMMVHVGTVWHGNGMPLNQYTSWSFELLLWFTSKGPRLVDLCLPTPRVHIATHICVLAWRHTSNVLCKSKCTPNHNIQNY